MGKADEEIKIESPKFYKKRKLSRKLCWVRSDKEWNHFYYVDISLWKKDDGKIVFTASGKYRWWWGQCLDFMNDYLKWDFLWDKIYYLWKNYHSNDMHAGTPKQENLLKMGRLAGVDLSSYDKQCKFLKEYNCYFDDNIVDWTSHPYKYGSEWLYRPIPETDLWEILSLLLEN